MSEWQKKKAKEFIDDAFDKSNKTSSMSAKEVEQAVIGSLLIEKTAINEVIEVLSSEEFFYLEEHKIIYSCILKMEASNQPIDLITVNEQINTIGKSKEAGGLGYLIDLTNKVNNAAHIGYYARLIMEHWVKRKTSLLSVTANAKAMDHTEDCFGILDEIEAGINAIKSKIVSGKNISVGQSISESLNHFANIKNNGGLLGVPTGIIELDRRTGGASGGDLILVGARPGAGKSAVKLIFAHNASVNFGISCLVVDYEDRPKQNDSRLMAMNTGFDYGDIYQGKSHIDFNFISQKMSMVDYSNMYFEYANYPLHVLVSKIKMYVRKFGVKQVLINQLSFIKVLQNFQREDQMIGHISGTLKQLATDLDIPIYLFLQLKREIDDRPDVRPHKGDIKLAGKLEEDADGIILLTRPQGYSWFRDSVKPYYYHDQIFDIENKILFDLCKWRNGETFEEWLNLEIGKHWLYGGTNPFQQHSMPLIQPAFAEIESKVDPLKQINGLDFFN